MIPTSAPEPALAAYEALARHYDEFTADHDYDGWTRSLEALLRRHGLRGRRLLDVGCGTGKSFLPFLERGWSVTACDLSPAMVAVAAGKPAAAAARLHVCDMRHLPRLGRFDVVTCLDDALNYLGAEADLVAAFRSARRNLARRGLYLFDLNTLTTYRGFFARTVSVSRSGVEFEWRGHGDGRAAPGQAVEATLTVRPPDGLPAESLHSQRHFPPPAVRAALRAAGLACAGVYGMSPDGRLARALDEEHHHKAIYVARHARHESLPRR